jgi:hypothetical protein
VQLDGVGSIVVVLPLDSIKPMEAAGEVGMVSPAVPDKMHPGDSVWFQLPEAGTVTVVAPAIKGPTAPEATVVVDIPHICEMV